MRAALGAAGLSALGASASGTMALLPAQAITALLLRDALRHRSVKPGSVKPGADQPARVGWPMLAAVSVGGGLVGAVLLLLEPPGWLRAVEPWLILFAVGVIGRGAAVAIRRGGTRRGGLGPRAATAAQAAVAVYGGYGGGATGLLTLAALTGVGLRDIRAMTVLKIVLTALMGAAAALVFATAGLVQWPATITVAVAALSGGLAGVEVVKRTTSPMLRAAVIASGAVLTLALLAFGPR